MKSIDLNADLGEGYPNDAEILKYVSSANIACGLHAGSPSIMMDTVNLAMKSGVSLGAHPGYPDREGFGREEMVLPFDELKAILLYQIGALYAIVNSEGGKLEHVKAHGAMYNSAARNEDIARAIVSAAKDIDPSLKIFGPCGSFLEAEALSHGMEFRCEVFADRAYLADGSLVPRSQEGALIKDRELCAARTLTMIEENYVKAISGERVHIKADTICLHGDSAGALDFARHLYRHLSENNVIIRSA